MEGKKISWKLCTPTRFVLFYPFSILLHENVCLVFCVCPSYGLLRLDILHDPKRTEWRTQFRVLVDTGQWICTNHISYEGHYVSLHQYISSPDEWTSTFHFDDPALSRLGCRLATIPFDRHLIDFHLLYFFTADIKSPKSHLFLRRDRRESLSPLVVIAVNHYPRLSC